MATQPFGITAPPAQPQTLSVGENRFFEDAERPARNETEGVRRGFTEAELADQVTRKWNESSDRLRTFFDIALECWDQYRNRQDFSDKEDWQARVTLAKAHSAVKQGVANFMRLLKQAGKYVLVEDPGNQNQSFAPYVREGVHRLWEVSGFNDRSREAMEAGLIMGLMAAREDWVYEAVTKVQSNGLQVVPVQAQEGKLKIRAVDPWTVRWGPETKGGNDIDWIIEEQIISMPSLRKMGFDIPKELVFDNARVDEGEQRKEQRTDEKQAKAPVERSVKVREYYGPVIDEETQQVVVPDAHLLIANNKFVLLAERNPLWRKKSPYVLASPLKVAFRFPGQGILEVNRELKRNIDAIAQMGTDYLKFSSLVMLEADMSVLENPEDIATGAEPGKIFRKRPGAGNIRALQQVPINPLQADLFNMMGAFNNEYQRGTFITDIVQGLLDTKGETTATEFSGTLTQTTVMLADIALALETQYLEPMADLTWDLALQFMDINSSPNWQRLLGPGAAQLDLLPRPVRLQLIQGNYEFRVRGISLQVEKQQQLGQLVNFLQVIGTLQPQFLILLNMPEIFRRIHESFAFDRPEQLLSPQAAQLFTALQQNLLLQSSPSEQFAQEAGSQLIQGLVQQAIAAAQPPPERTGQK